MKTVYSRTTTFLRKNLFNSIPNTIITIVLGVALYFVIAGFLEWAVFKAVWTGDSRAVARPGGATWAFIVAKFRFFMYGFYPEKQIWRINLYYILIAATFVPLFIRKFPGKILVFASYFILWPLLTSILVGGGFGLKAVSSNDWGGLALTVILSLLGLLFSFPLGVITALGRRSKMPVIRVLSTAYIEFFRGIPLITILFMSSVVVPFFLPPGVSVDKMVRVVIGMSLFQSAYLAEVFRGGFQAIPRGQYEASEALGMSYVQQNYLIIFPQVLRATISNIGGISISFIKDTTLVLIIGMFDLLGVVNPTSNDSHWLGMEPEGYVFAGLVYWFICFAVSKITLGIEKKAHSLPAGRSLEITEEISEGNNDD